MCLYMYVVVKKSSNSSLIEIELVGANGYCHFIVDTAVEHGWEVDR